MMRSFFSLNQKGMGLTIVMITLILVSLIAGYALNLSYNQARLLQASNGKRVKIYYAAQAGVVNALWRIKTDATLIANPNATLAYNLDLEPDAVDDVSVTIGQVINGLRAIQSRGIDHYRSTAAARRVNVITYYAPPEGRYRNLDVTGNAGNIQLSSAGGNVSMGNTATGLAIPGTSGTARIGPVSTIRPFLVTGHANNRYTASFLSNTGYGVGLGEDISGSANYGTIQARGPGNATVQLGLNTAVPNATNPAGVCAGMYCRTNVSDSTVISTAYDLLIAGANPGGGGNTGELGITSGGQQGEIKVAQSAGYAGSDNQYYAVFA